MDNPFERYGLDPREGPQGITERLRELAEEAEGAERERIRAAWEALTKHPQERARLALEAHPESRPELGSPPPRSSEDLPDLPVLARAALEPSDLVSPPSLLAILGGTVEPVTLPLVPVEEDPALR